MTSATEVVIFAMACMALNILVGYTGLVSFGHGAWFGLGRLRGGADAAQLVPGLDPAADRCRRSVVVAVARCVVRLPGPAPARRLFLAADAGALGDALRGRVPLDRRSPAARTASAASRGRRSLGVDLENLDRLLRARRRDRLRRR